MKRKTKISVIILLIVALGIAGWWGINWYVAGQKDIISLSKEGNIKELKYVLRWRPDLVNYYDFVNRTPLIYAVASENLEVVKILIDAGADIELRSSETESPFFIAVETGNIDIIKILLNAGADVNAKTNYGWTPLDVAINNQDEDIIDLLLKHGGKSGWEFISPKDYSNPEEIAEQLHDMALINEKHNRYSEAEILYKKALEVTEMVFGKDHPKVASVLEDMGTFYEKLDRKQEAEKSKKRAKEIRAKAK